MILESILFILICLEGGLIAIATGRAMRLWRQDPGVVRLQMMFYGFAGNYLLWLVLIITLLIFRNAYLRAHWGLLFDGMALLSLIPLNIFGLYAMGITNREKDQTGKGSRQ